MIIRGLSYIFDKKSLKALQFLEEIRLQSKTKIHFFEVFKFHYYGENKKIAMRKKLRDAVYQTSIALLIVNLFHYIVISNITEFKKRLINIKAKVLRIHELKMKKFEPLKTGDYILISLAIERVIF